MESLERVVASESDEPRVGSGEDIVSVPTEFDATHMNARETYVHDRFHVGRLAGAAILDPPRIASTKRQDIVREDEPWYIAAAFPKIFQTGGRALLGVRAATERPQAIRVLRGLVPPCPPRARRPCAEASVLLLFRGKSYFVKKSYGDQAFEEHTPEALLRMGKAPLSRMLCAYEDKLPGLRRNSQQID